MLKKRKYAKKPIKNEFLRSYWEVMYINLKLKYLQITSHYHFDIFKLSPIAIFQGRI